MGLRSSEALLLSTMHPGLCPSRLQRTPPSVEPMCSPGGEKLGNFGCNVPEGDPLAVLFAAAEKIGWLGRDSLAAFLQSAQRQVQDEGYDP